MTGGCLQRLGTAPARHALTGCLLLASGCSDAAAPVPPAACPSDQLTAQDGTCRPVGVPASLCPEGFVAEAGGCSPVLPPEPCDAGRMALPGDDSCQEVWPCGDGPWGDAPIDAETQHVDGSYAGGDSDGTAVRPWTTVHDAVMAAPAGGLVAIAAGSYPEHVFVAGKPVRLWGRCPDLVEIAGPASSFAAIDIQAGADGSEIRALALRGAAFGLGVTAAENILVEGVWVHDTRDIGIEIDDTLGPTSMTMRRVLVERAASSGLSVYSARVDAEGLEIRDGLADADGRFGRGLSVAGSPPYAVRAEVSLTHAVIARNTEGGMVIEGTDVSLERVVVADTRPQAASGMFGRGMALQNSSAVLAGCVFTGNSEYGLGVTFDSHAEIETSVIRDSRYHAESGQRGGGVAVHGSTAVLRRSLVEGGHTFGLSVADGSAEVEAALFRSIQPDGAGQFGDGVLAVSIETRTSIELSRSRIVDVSRAGVGNFGGSVALFEDELRCNRVQLHGDEHQGYAFEYTDLGGNSCGCGAEPPGECQVQVSGLQPPLPPD